MITPPVPVGYKTRLQWVDAAKGGCILLVLLAHTYLARVGDNPYAGRILHQLYYFSACYMPTFFVISGYTFMDTPDILVKKFRQLVIPYAQWALIYLVVFISASIYKGEIYPLHWMRKLAGCLYSRCDIYANGAGFRFPLLPEGAGPLWFLTALFTSYSLYILVHRARKKIKYPLIVLYILLTLIFHRCPVLLPWSADTAFVGALFIYFGHWMKTSGVLTKLSFKAIAIALCVLPLYIWTVNYNGGSGAMYCRDFGSTGWYAPLIFIVMGISGSYLWCVFCQLLEKLHLEKLLAKAGKHSLTLLCSHMLIYMALAFIFTNARFYYPTLEAITPYVFGIQISAALFYITVVKAIRKSTH